MYYTSKKCRLCESKKIKIGLDLKKIQIGEKYTNHPVKKNKKFPLTIGYCPNCKNVQTMEIINQKLLWKNYTYLSGQTKQILSHFKDISNHIVKKIKISPNELALDIGSNDGSLLKNFKNKKMKVLGIDPADNIVKIANKKGIKTICDYFTYKLSKKIKKKFGQAKIITCFNSFAHTANLKDIISGINNLLTKDGLFVFECQYLGNIYKNKVIGTFFHEHIYHHSITSLNNLFKSYHLNFFDVKKVNIQKGSIIGLVSKKNFSKDKKIKHLILKEKLNGWTKLNELEKLEDFVNLQRKKIMKITKNIKLNKIGIYGSARSAPTFVNNYGINEKIKYIFDDHPLKVNKYSPLFNSKVLPTKKLYSLGLDYLIILAYLHSKKIIRNNIKFILRGGSFILVYPEIKIINKSNYRKYLKNEN
jgi:SAM-dependent methyltransferase